jgi:hypothetical protein
MIFDDYWIYPNPNPMIFTRRGLIVRTMMVLNQNMQTYDLDRQLHIPGS